MSAKSVVVTGAAGFIGSHLTDRCLDLGWDVTAVDAFTDYYDEPLKRANLAAAAAHPQCEVVEADLLDLDLAALVAGADVVFHLAAQPGVRASWDQFDLYARLNLSATQRLLDAARGTSLERLVIASSSSIYGDAEAMPSPETIIPRPVSPYGVTKVAVEHLAQVYWRSFGVPTACLRYFTVYGPRQRPDMAFNRLIASALSDEPFTVFGDEPDPGFHVGGRRSRGDALGGQVWRTWRRVQPRRWVAALDEPRVRDSGRPARPAGRARLPRAPGGDARDTAADIELARQVLGYEPSVTLESGLKAQLEWQRAALADLSAPA